MLTKTPTLATPTVRFLLYSLVLGSSLDSFGAEAIAPTAPAEIGSSSTLHEAEVLGTSFFTERDFLITKGTDMVTRDGRTVVLRGVNLGGWLLPTTYMSPIEGSSVRDATDIYHVLAKRFGPNGRNKLLRTYHHNFITTDDLDRIAKTGANAVRVPFWWRNFMDENGNLMTHDDGTPDFDVLDFLVWECSSRGIYVILDLHGAPGSQNGRHYSGQETSIPTLFANTADGDRSRELTVKLWGKIADHFKDNPAVAGYDLLNEPYWTRVIGAEDRWRIWTVYDRIYEAIRNVDLKHIIIMESSWHLDSLPDPESLHCWKKNVWKNVVYSSHYYPPPTAKTTAQTLIAAKARLRLDLRCVNRYQVPLYIGELNYHNDWDAWEEVLSQFDKNGLSYTAWSYKCPYSTSAVWGMMYRKTAARADVSVMTFQEIKAIFSQTTRESFEVNANGVRLLCRHFVGDLDDFGLNDDGHVVIVAGSKFSGSKKEVSLPK